MVVTHLNRRQCNTTELTVLKHAYVQLWYGTGCRALVIFSKTL